ncbi:MAG: phage tail tape measure protein [Bacteroidales bacterium]|nr:phage tail tape measure protein [Bacteroidales bacterium]
MGLAATLDHLGQTSEVSSTAYSQVVTGMFKDTEAYARAARMSVESFSKLLKKDANEAFLKLLEGLHNNDAGMEELIKSMGDLDLEGKRAISVIGVLSNNTKLLREQQKISNREFAKGTSLQQEFNVKNNNAQAILEKKRKILSNLAIDLGQKLMPVLTVSTSGFTYFVKAVSVLTDFTIRNSGAILRLTASIAAYTIATKLTTLWVNRQTQATLAQIIVTKARAFAEGASTAITQLYAAATMLLTGNVKGATQAVRAFNSVIKVSPIGLLVGLLTLAAGALITFWNRTEEVVTQGVSLTKEIIRLQKEKTEQIVREKNELNGLVSQIILTNENSSVRKGPYKSAANPLSRFPQKPGCRKGHQPGVGWPAWNRELKV